MSCHRCKYYQGIELVPKSSWWEDKEKQQLCKYLQNISKPSAVLKSFVKGVNQHKKQVMVPKKGELPQERMNEAKKAHLVSQAGTWSWRSASSWQPRAFIQWKVTGTVINQSQRSA